MRSEDAGTADQSLLLELVTPNPHPVLASPQRQRSKLFPTNLRKG